MLVKITKGLAIYLTRQTEVMSIVFPSLWNRIYFKITNMYTAKLNKHTDYPFNCM